MQPFLLAVKCTYMTSVCTGFNHSFLYFAHEVNTVIFLKKVAVFMSDVYDSDISVNKLLGL
jgi:hypothetical protein